MALIDRIDGLRCVDAGRLEMARIVESLTALLISINVRHKTHAGIKITGVVTSVVVVLAGGTGGAKLARGMLDVVGDELVVVANTADDIEAYGAYVCPDPDLVRVLARRPHRRARLGPAGRHLPRDGAAARARRRRAGSTSATATSRSACAAPSAWARAPR